MDRALDRERTIHEMTRIITKHVAARYIYPLLDSLLGASASSCLGVSVALLRHAESGATMTASAVFKSQVAAERPLAIVAGGAIHPGQRKVLGRRRGTNLSRLRRTGCESMTIGTIESFAPAMLSMAESITKGPRLSRSATVRFLVVTNSTGP